MRARPHPSARLQADRRQALLGALLGAPLLGAGGCGRAPFRADVLVTALPTFAEGSFLPWTGGGQRKAYLDAIYDHLVLIDPRTGEALPGLATAWECSADGKSWRLDLRRGVRFQRDRGEFTSADVAFSLHEITSPRARAGPSSPLRRLIAGVDAHDPYTVVIRLTRPDPELARGYLANTQQVAIACAAYHADVGEAEANARPVGSGAYLLERFSRDSLIRVSLRPDREALWRPTPDFEALEFVNTPEASTRLAMLKAGEADIAPIGFDAIPELEHAGLRIVTIPQSWSPVVRLGGLVEDGARSAPDNPWADVRVRRALNLAIDKQAIIDRIFAGRGRLAASDTPVEAWAGIAPYPYDPAAAQALLAEAGYPNGFDLLLKTFTTTPGAELPTVAQAVGLYWRRIGVRARIEPIDWTSLRSAWTSGAANRYAWTHRGFPFTSAQNGLEAGFDARSAFAAYSSPALQDMLDAHGGELDPVRRRAWLTSIGQKLRDEAANIFIAHIDEPYATSTKVGVWIATSSNALSIERVRRAAAGSAGP